MNNASAFNLPPDGYSRFYVIVKTLEHIYEKTTKTLKILDVGGCSPYLQECLDNSTIKYELTIVDILPKPEGLKAKYVQADVTKWKQNDEDYDVVVSTDVLEHIPIELKDEFVSACIRMSKSVVIIAAPFDTDGVDTAEKLVNEFNIDLFGIGQNWLEEHFEYTKPSIPRVKKILENEKLEYEVFGANNLYSWITSAHINLMDAKLGFKRSDINQIRAEYNRSLSESIEFMSPSYRHFFVIYKNEKFKATKLRENLNSKNDPVSYLTYLHGIMKVTYERSIQLKHSLEVSRDRERILEQKIYNEQIYSNKLRQIIEDNNNSRLVKNYRRIKHPLTSTKSVLKKITKGKAK